MSTPAAPTSAIALANVQQNAASDPNASVFVSASAGSGKTKLLIDRLLRLMLPRKNPDDPFAPLTPGTSPGRILCLTFTKAAAAEMAIRLQKTLGAWVTMPDARLERELAKLGVPASARPEARALFARVLDLPGGMRIGTIHAFCQSLLRRFPLEAATNPHFTLMEDTDASLALTDATETELSRLPAGTVETLAAQISLRDLTDLLAELRSSGRSGRILDLARTTPEAARALLLQALDIAGAAPDGDPLLYACETIPDEDALRDALRTMSEAAPAKTRERATLMLDWLAGPPSARAARWADWSGMFLTSAGTPRKHAGASAKYAADHPEILERFETEAARILAVEESRRAIALTDLTLALLRTAAPVLERYASGKALRGQVEYDDLILRTLGLLHEPGAAWVLYKLDGGIDHLLLDEVQDTSREQWRIAGGLTEEFFSGIGAHDAQAGPRTVFAVGDYKQSIYGFQGADPEAFSEWRHAFEQRARNAGATWREPRLTVSFRSTAPVLNLVDAVFAHPLAARGVSEPGQPMPRHESARPGEGGRVELWPLAPRDDAENGQDAPDPWAATSRNAAQISPQQRLADTLARWIAAQLLAPPAPGEKQLLPGDVLILVPRRSAFVQALIRALKTADVPVATLVRTGLADQTVVQDLMALCDALLLPQDDLTLACVLTSPLGGLTDDSLMALAMRRDGEPLWTVLRERHAERPDWSAAWSYLSTLFRRVDYASPYILLSEALGVQGGRARILARLGPEAAEPIDELLSAALRYEESHAPSLQGFLHWLRNSNETVKREPEASGNAVRVMTAHGSKGLQARLVILPDTIGAPRSNSRLLWLPPRSGRADLPVFVPRTDIATNITKALREKLKEQAAEEYNRLLYVALTRASDRLVVCGWEPSRPLGEESWYRLCAAGFEAVGAVSEPFDLGWEGERLVLEERTTARQPQTTDCFVPPPAPLPGWTGRAPLWIPAPLPPEPSLARPLAPSRPDDAAFGEQPASRSPLEIAGLTPNAAREAAFRRGALVHALLQFLPDRPAADRTDVGYNWLLRPGNGLDEQEAARLVARVIEVMEKPELAPLFGPDSRAEQRLAGVIGQEAIVGQVDRMVVLPDRVLVCDFKTNRRPPASVERTPPLYLRQMAAYRALLRALYPTRQVQCSLVWTEIPTVTVIPDALLDAHGLRDSLSGP